jgi:hypothetical protein
MSNYELYKHIMLVYFNYYFAIKHDAEFVNLKKRGKSRGV